MAPPPSSAWATLGFRWTGAALPHDAVSTLGIANGAVTQEIFDLAEAWWDDYAKGEWAPGTVLTELTLKVGPSDLGPTYSRTLNLAGTNPGAPDSPNVAVLIRKTVFGISARKGGRMYLPAVSEGATNSGGTLLAGTIDVIDDAMEFLRGGLVAKDCDPVVFHDDGSPPTQIDQLQCQPLVATQRRRLRP